MQVRNWIDISSKVANNLRSALAQEISMNSFLQAAVLIAAAAVPVTAHAEKARFTANLSGNSLSAHTGSPAHATAVIQADSEAQTVAVQVQVVGISLGELWDDLVAAPIGPVHLHQYAGSDLGDPAASVLAFPVPFGTSYRATIDGFSIDTGARPYAEGQATLGTKARFDQFMAALKGGAIVLNIHTDKFNAGEISGPVLHAAPE